MTVASGVFFDHVWGLSYHSLPHAAEAKADQALKRFTDNLHAGIILTDRVCRQDSRDQGFPTLQALSWGQSWFILLPLCFCPFTLGYSCVSQAGPPDGK